MNVFLYDFLQECAEKAGHSRALSALRAWLDDENLKRYGISFFHDIYMPIMLRMAAWVLLPGFIAFFIAYGVKLTAYYTDNHFYRGGYMEFAKNDDAFKANHPVLYPVYAVTKFVVDFYAPNKFQERAKKWILSLESGPETYKKYKPYCTFLSFWAVWFSMLMGIFYIGAYENGPYIDNKDLFYYIGHLLLYWEMAAGAIATVALTWPCNETTGLILLGMILIGWRYFEY